MRDSIFFIMDGSVASPVRMVAPMLELQRRGYKVVGAKAQEEKRIDFREFTALILQRPVSYNALELIERSKDFGIIVIVDLDDDFLAIPPEHPGYKIIGKGNPTAMQALELAYRAADYITVSTLELAHRYKGYYCDKPFKVIPNGWDKSMRGWAYRHNKGKVHIGYAGSLTHFNDVKPIMPVLIELSREFEEVVVVIAACEDLYALLRKLPESRKIFLPGVDYTAYPAVLGWFDIMLAPLSNSYFNQAKSDIKLVEAGAKGIPFVASPLPFYKEYASDGRGGLFADWNEGSWYDNIKHLVQDEATREVLGKEGKERAAHREQGAMNHWDILLRTT